MHEDDETRRYRALYCGGAGVVRALDTLQRRGLAELRRDYVPYLDRPYEPDVPDDDRKRSLMEGETGIRLVLQRLAPSSENGDRLAELVAQNAEDEHCELFWGSPGTMLAAAAMHEHDGRGEVARSVARERGMADAKSGIRRRISGRSGFTAGRSSSGSVRLTGSRGACSPWRGVLTDEMHRRAAKAMTRYAIEEDGLANWKPTASMESLRSNRDGSIRTQWCHGAPGIVTSLAQVALDDDEHERLLCAGGELTWLAGPLTNGANLCHGTAGNGYAFLALLERTGDELWLERARAFAMHAISQVARERTESGRGHYSLWSGDLGTALYLADCVAGGGALPLP